ncbi:MAG TPA: hypothetical protein VF240_19720 [Pyrinomonadaceae bacterium]
MSEAPVIARAALPRRARDFLRRVGLGDALMLLYLAAFAREYLWAVADQRLAWALTLLLAALAWYFYVATGEERERTPPAFWLVVALPLAFVYALRVPFPDVSFDVLNYRLLHAERALAGPLFMPGDFFPAPIPFNPSPDIVTGLCRRLLGYRLGTLPNLLALVWAAQVVERLLRPYISGARRRAFGVLLIMLCEHSLFEINNYMVDVLALPLILEAVYVALRRDGERGSVRVAAARLGLLLGVAVAFKLTNLTVACFIALIYTYQLLFKLRPARREILLSLALAAAAFLVPLLPFTFYIYGETGSPVFPLFNTIFESPYWAAQDWRDPRWGPAAAGWWGKLLWPVASVFTPERLSELNVYSGRLALGFVAALAGLVLARRDALVRALCLVVLLDSLTWAATTGYVRYVLHLELLGGALVLMLAASAARANVRMRAALKYSLACALWLALAAQGALACRYVLRTEWGGRPTVFSQPRTHLREAAHLLLRDHSLADFLPDKERALFAGVEVWVDSSMKSNGFEALLRPRAPVINARQPEYFTTRASEQRFAEALDRAAGKRLFSLSFPEDLKSARASLERRGLKIVGQTPVTIPFYSPHNNIGLYLLEVERGAAVPSPAPDGRAAALPDGAYRARLSLPRAPARMKPGERASLLVRVRNEGSAPWPARGNAQGMLQVNVGDRWLATDGRTVVNDLDGRTALPRDLGSGDEAELTLNVIAPKAPGEYVLEIDMVHEGVTWFYEKGSQTLRVSVRVE